MQDILRKHGDAYRQDLPGFVGQMQAHVKQLQETGSVDTLSALQREAHDMKGQAATFGLTGISAIANSLCSILEHPHAISPTLIDVLQAHVTTLKVLLEKDDPQLVATTIATAKTL